MTGHDRIDIRAGFCCCLLIASIQAGEYKITSALDANLFILETGPKIRLAYVETPSMSKALENFAKRMTPPTLPSTVFLPNWLAGKKGDLG